MVKRVSTTPPAWKCPHCGSSQLWIGKSNQALIACSFCRGISLMERPSDMELTAEERDGYMVKRDFPARIIEAIYEEENK